MNGVGVIFIGVKEKGPCRLFNRYIRLDVIPLEAGAIQCTMETCVR